MHYVMDFSMQKVLFLLVTIQKIDVYAWWNDVAKWFKTCHIFWMRKPMAISLGHSICMYIVFFYHFLLFFPNKCLGLCWHRFSYSKNMTNFETFTKVISSSISLFFADEWNRYVLLIRLNQIFQYFSFVRWQQNCWPIEVTQPQGQFFQVDLLGNNISIAPKNKFGSRVCTIEFLLQ